MSSGWDQDQRPRDYVAEARARTLVIAILAIGGTVSFLSGLKRTDGLAVAIGCFLYVMAFAQWKLR